MARLSFLALIVFVVAFVGVQAAPVHNDANFRIVKKSVSASITATATSTASAAATSTNSTSSTSGSATFVAGYADFQISNGTGGGAQTQANEDVCTDPFNGIDLSTVDDDTVEIMNTMREAAESAETDDFDPQIDAASGTEADALQVGKIKNKVLKLTGEVQVLNTKIAKAQATGDDTSDLESDLADEQQKLTTNIATNTDNAGKTSQGVA